MTPTGNTILITGGGSGIGKALAERFHALGNTVIIAGRRRVVLDDVVAAHPGMAAYEVDVTDPASIAALAKAAAANHPALNVLINNAGVMIAEDLLSQDLAVAEATVATNLLGPIRLTSALLPHLLTQADAVVVNVSSGLAFVPLVATPTYSAAKAAIHSYTVSLRRQLRDTPVEVIELVPPGVQTDLMPGHAADPQMMPLKAFIDETMALFQQQPTPPEICVETVAFLRQAEARGQFGQVFAALNG